MQPADSARFRDLMRGMARLYGQEPDALVLDAYWLALREWDYADVQEAAGQLMRTAKFMPRPAEFEALRQAGRPTAGEAWLAALEHAASSAYRTGPHGDPLIDRAVRALGGYRVIAMCENDKLGFLERRFCEHYEAMQDAEDVREAVPQIAQSSRARLSGPPE